MNAHEFIRREGGLFSHDKHPDSWYWVDARGSLFLLYNTTPADLVVQAGELLALGHCQLSGGIQLFRGVNGTLEAAATFLMADEPAATGSPQLQGAEWRGIGDVPKA